MIETLFENRITSETPLKKMEFLFELYKVPCFPRGELVAVAGKAKSGKTSFLSMLMGTGVKPGNEPPSFSWRKKRTKRTSTPSKASPYMGRMQLITKENLLHQDFGMARKPVP